MPYPFVGARSYTRGREGPIEVLGIHAMEAAEEPDTAAEGIAGDVRRLDARY